MLALLSGWILSSDQAAAVMIAVITLGTTCGGFFAGRVTFRQSVIENAKLEAESWKKLYDVTTEEVKKNEEHIKELVADGHAKDMKIAALTGKIDVIQSFLEKALGKELTFDSTTTTTSTTQRS